MTSEEIAAKNREHLVDASRVMERVVVTMRHFHNQVEVGFGVQQTRTDLAHPAPEYEQGLELAERVFYWFPWGGKPPPGAGELPDRSVETTMESYWRRAVCRADGSLEIESAEGDLLVSEAEGGQVTPLRAVVLRGQQGFGKKTFRATIATAFAHPVRVHEIRTSRPQDEFELEGRAHYDDRRW